jgi:hypothetical protein
VYAHRDDGKRFVVRADEKLTVFVELESVIRDGQRVGSSDWLDGDIQSKLPAAAPKGRGS